MHLFYLSDQITLTGYQDFICSGAWFILSDYMAW